VLVSILDPVDLVEGLPSPSTKRVSEDEEGAVDVPESAYVSAILAGFFQRLNPWRTIWSGRRGSNGWYILVLGVFRLL